jgi:hypothetical protein
MIIVRVELWPRGDKSKARCLGEAEIANVGGTKEIGDYDVRLLKWGAGRRTWKKGRLAGFPRLKLGPWDLLYRALAAIVHDRNRDTKPPTADGGEPVGHMEEPETCPKCGGEVQGGFGLAGGGYGAYKFCVEDACDWFEKTPMTAEAE